MKVILTQDIAKLGRRFDVKDVPSGHALNFLIPRGVALPATKENLKRHEAMMGKYKEQKTDSENTLQGTLANLKEKTITHTVSANEKGHLFSGITTDIISSILKEEGYEVDASTIKLDQPIKEVGTFTIEIEKEEIKGKFTLELVSEK